MRIPQVSIRDLRNRGGDVVDRVERGEHVIVTRDGRPVAELHPLAKSPVPLESLLERWRRLPVVDADLLRADIDDVLDSSL
jgi:prevent-host-death family protein